jgi:hypothetical protein
MSSSLSLIPVATMASKEHWKQFTALARSQGQTISALLRLPVVKELRRAEKAAVK